MAKLYRPKTSELVLTEEVKETIDRFLVGVKPKVINISGDLAKRLDTVISSIATPHSDEEHELLNLSIIDAFKNAFSRYVIKRKKYHFVSGFNMKGFNTLLFGAVLPVPHIDGISLYAIKLKLEHKGDVFLESSICYLLCDETIPEHQVKFYQERANGREFRSMTLSERIEDIIFDLIPFNAPVIQAA